MTPRLLDPAAVNVTPSELLRVCREAVDPDPGKDLPEPSWVERTSESEYRTIWSRNPGGVAVEPVLVWNRPDGMPRWEATLRFWKRYGSPTDREIVAIVHFLRTERECPLEQIAQRAAPILDVPSSEVWVESYLRMHSLPDSVLEQLGDGAVTPRHLRFLQAVPEPLQGPLFRALGAGRVDWSVQESRQLSEATRRMPREAYDGWLARLGEEGNRDASPRERGKRLLQDARARAFPSLHERRQRFEHDLETLDLDGRIQVAPPDFFEGDYLEFRFRCRRDESLRTLLDEVGRCRILFEHV